LAGHRWASSSNTLSNKRPRFNRPYIPALKDRGFTARLVNKPFFQQFKENGFAVLRLFACYVCSKFVANGSPASSSCFTRNTKLKSRIAFSTAESFSCFEAES